MKFFKFILFTILILIITIGIPFIIFQNETNNQHLTNVPGSSFQGPMGYVSKLLQDPNTTQEIKENVTALNNEYSNLLKEEKKELLNLFFVTSLILGIVIIAFGVFLLKATKYKLFSSVLITSGILSIISYVLIYVTILFTLI